MTMPRPTNATKVLVLCVGVHKTKRAQLSARRLTYPQFDSAGSLILNLSWFLIF